MPDLNFLTYSKIRLCSSKLSLSNLKKKIRKNFTTWIGLFWYTYLFLCDPHIVGDPWEDCGFEEVALVPMSRSPALQLGSLLLPTLHQIHNLTELFIVDLKQTEIYYTQPSSGCFWHFWVYSDAAYPVMALVENNGLTKRRQYNAIQNFIPQLQPEFRHTSREQNYLVGMSHYTQWYGKLPIWIFASDLARHY